MKGEGTLTASKSFSASPSVSSSYRRGSGLIAPQGSTSTSESGSVDGRVKTFITGSVTVTPSLHIMWPSLGLSLRIGGTLGKIFNYRNICLKVYFNHLDQRLVKRHCTYRFHFH